METVTVGYSRPEDMIPESAYFTPFPFTSQQTGFESISNIPPLNDKLNQQYNALLNPENKEAVSSKIDQYNEAGKAFITNGQSVNVIVISFAVLSNEFNAFEITKTLIFQA